MTVTTRTVMWSGLLLFLVAGVALVAIVWTLPPEVTPLAFFFFFLFLATCGLVSALMAAFMRYRGVKRPGTALRQGLLAGLLAVILAVLQFLELLDVMTLAASVFLALLVEILVQQRQRLRRQPPLATGSKGTKTLSAQKRRGPSRTGRARRK